MNKIIRRKENINRIITVPGDKSISHRSVMFSSIAEGTSYIEGFLTGADCLSTISCFKELGIKIEIDNENVTVYGKGINGLSAPKNALDVGNSGTTIRLMTGLLAGQNFDTEITGDASIQKRPMGRVIEPLTRMGARIESEKKGLAPLKIYGSKLNGIDYSLPVASAQVKSAILLAGLYASGETIIHEPEATRDHSEIMLNYLGADIVSKQKTIYSKGVKNLYGKKIIIPGDISSAAFFIAAGLIVPNSRIIITNVGVNVTRTGIITALREMGADIQILNRRDMCGEAVADIEVKTSKLQGTTISGSLIPRMIDEIPVFAVAAMFAEGTTIIKDAAELKVKESDRIKTMVTELKKLGADIAETEDGMIINGGAKLRGAEVESHNDHRVAMSLAVAALACEGEILINGADCVDISFPGFYDLLEDL